MVMENKKQANFWEVCLLDTENDINRRKILAITAFSTLRTIFNIKNNSIKIKLRPFSAYVASVFLCNSKLCTLTKKLEN
jgi:hypothetical protein